MPYVSSFLRRAPTGTRTSWQSTHIRTEGDAARRLLAEQTMVEGEKECRCKIKPGVTMFIVTIGPRQKSLQQNGVAYTV